jgi:hypothetical protein
MRYDEYLAAGFQIATGVIEGVCRHLIKDRMDVTGARWSLKSAEPSCGSGPCGPATTSTSTGGRRLLGQPGA